MNLQFTVNTQAERGYLTQDHLVNVISWSET